MVPTNGVLTSLTRYYMVPTNDALTSLTRYCMVPTNDVTYQVLHGADE